MLKARVLSTTMTAKPDAPIEVNMEMWVLDNSLISCPYEVVIITEEEYKAMDSTSDFLRECLIKRNKKLEEENNKLNREINEKQEKIFKLMLNNDAEQACLREKIKKLEEENEAIQKDIKDLEEKMAQDADEVDIHSDGTIVFKKKRVSELEKEVERLKEENKALKEDKFTMKITGELFYKED